MKTFWLHGITVLWALIIAVLTLTPAPDLPETPFWDIPHFDKLVHFGLFALLAFFGVMGFYKHRQPAIAFKKQALWTSILAIVYGCLIEFIQGFVPGRSGEVLDILANAAGAIAGPIAFLVIKKFL